MISVAILGFGTVGSGVAEVLSNNSLKINNSAKEEIVLKYILDVRSFPESPFADLIVNDFDVILKDPDICIVAECIGGTGFAYECTKQLLLAGKSVVTSNKDLVAAYGSELLAIAVENNQNYLFEASVGGGIPIIRPMTQDLCANVYSEIFGILNGTTNYILTRMSEKGTDYKSALKEAQELGYAEANPDKDINGLDTRNKICILASLAFGNHIYPESIPAEGISGITHEDILLTDSIGYKIKLIGRTQLMSDGKIFSYVAPNLIPFDSQLSGVNDVFNGIVVRGDNVGEVMFYGKGAGKYPTASAVVADIIDAAKHIEKRKYLFWADSDDKLLSDGSDFVSSWYIRCENDCDASVFDKFTMISANAFMTGPISDRDLKHKLVSLNDQYRVINSFRVLA